jgi:hypothetical protein
MTAMHYEAPDYATQNNENADNQIHSIRPFNEESSNTANKLSAGCELPACVFSRSVD